MVYLLSIHFLDRKVKNLNITEVIVTKYRIFTRILFINSLVVIV